MGGEVQNEVFFYKIPIIKQDTNFISQTVDHDKHLTTTIATAMPQNLSGFSSDFMQFFPI